MIAPLLHRLKTSPQVRESAGVFASRVFAMALSVLTGFLLARGLGPEDYGRYGYAFSILSMLILLVQLGLPMVVLRETGKAREQNTWSEVKGLRRFAFLWAAVAGGLFVAMFHGLAAWGLSDSAGRWAVVRAMGPFLILVSWVSIQSMTLQGLHRIVVANFPVYELFYALLIATLFVTSRGQLHLEAVVGALLASLAVGVVVFQGVLHRSFPKAYRKQSPSYHVRAWLASALPIFLAGSMFTLNGQVDILMLGMFRGNEEIGLYRLAVRLAAFVAFPLLVANASIGPRIVGFFVRGEMEALAHWIRRLIRIAFVAALLVWLGFALSGRWILGLAGEAYRAGYPALLLLGLAQLVNVAAGSVGWVLQMTHNEKDNAVGVGAALVLNVLLNALLTPRWGYVGTAVATALSLAAWNLILTAFVWKRFRIRVGVL